MKDPQTGHQHHLADSAVRVRHRYTGQLEQHVLLIDDPAELGELRLVDPTLAPGWTATLAPGMDGWCGLEVTDPDDGLLYVGTVHLPDAWSAAVDRYGCCVVYVGDFRLTENPDDTLRVLRAAATAGQLMGARMPVAWRRT